MSTSVKTTTTTTTTIVNIPTKQSKCFKGLQTITTLEQELTEIECEPFFVNLRTIPKSQLDHLRRVGLLKPLPLQKQQHEPQQTSSSSDKVDVDVDVDVIIELDNSSNEPIDLVDTKANTVRSGTVTVIDEIISPVPSNFNISNEISTNRNSNNNNNTSTTTGSNTNEGGDDDDLFKICLLRTKHGEYLQQVWDIHCPLRSSFVSLDASRPWILYWCLHGCDLLSSTKEIEDEWYGFPRTVEQRQSIVQALRECFSTTPTIHLSKDIVQKDSYLLGLIQMTTTDTIVLPDYIEFTNVGGFGGGCNQMAHAATTYAAINALIILTPYESTAYDLLQQVKSQIYPWLVSLLNPDGSMRMHHDGEIDVRASYCILSVASLLGYFHTSSSPSTTCSTHQSVLLDQSVIRYIAKCQTFEGGFGGEPFSEAHGGYTFCAIAAVQIWMTHADYSNNTNSTSTSTNSGSAWGHVRDLIDVSNLSGWLTRRQMSFEGGFNGRCNKLVDGCYSFWQGGAIAIVTKWEQEILSNGDGTTIVNDPWMTMYKTNNNHTDKDSTNTFNTNVENEGDADGKHNVSITSTDDSNTKKKVVPLLFDEGMLQRYILLCAQDVHGGLRDKPSKSRDFYHTCYNLSGLSISQHYSSSSSSSSSTTKLTLLFGHPELSPVAQTHPCYNIRTDKIDFHRQKQASQKD